MSAPPPYSPLPTASSVSNLLSNMRVNFDREHRSLGTDGRAFELWPLPPGVTVEKVYSDWFSYLVKSAKIWWEESNPDGAYIWDKLEKTMGRFFSFLRKGVYKKGVQIGADLATGSCFQQFLF